VKVLLDSCVWGGARVALAGHGHDVIWAGEWAEDPGDDEILARAHREGRVLVTLDKDFGELAVVHGQPHSGIIRLVGFSARDQARACQGVLATHGDELTRGAIATVSGVQLRLRPPPGAE
jgi:predicted nuclease of predicted toxin-antitoxin system